MAKQSGDDPGASSPSSSKAGQGNRKITLRKNSTPKDCLGKNNCGTSTKPLVTGLVAVSVESTKCIICLASFKSAEELGAHVRIVHARSGRYTRRATNISEEQELEFETPPTPLTREGVNTKPPRRKRRAPGSAGSHQCLECGKRFQQLGHLRNHQRLHTGDRPFVCQFCGKRFPQSGHLVSHVNSHTNTRPYGCQFCKKAFTQSGHLRNHERLHLGIRPYQCAQCAKSFTQSGHLVNHLRLHDGEKPYRCSVCERQFTQSGHLASHVKIHDNSRQHQCNICHKGFTRAEYLMEHQRIHSDPRLFACPFSGCKARFSNKNFLSIHLQYHKPQQTRAVYKRDDSRKTRLKMFKIASCPKSIVVNDPTSSDYCKSQQQQQQEPQQKQQRKQTPNQNVTEFLDNANYGGSYGLSGYPVIVRVGRVDSMSEGTSERDDVVIPLDDVELETDTVLVKL